MPVLHGPDDVLGAERRVTAEEHAIASRLESLEVDLRHVPLVEFDAEVAFDPGECVFLADGEDDVVRLDEFLANYPLGGDGALRVEVVLDHIEGHAAQLAVLEHEVFRRTIDDDLDVFFFGVFELPGRGLEELARLARHDFHVLRAQAQGRAAAVHRGVADTDDQHLLANALYVLERHRLEPGDADVDVGSALGSAW